MHDYIHLHMIVAYESGRFEGSGPFYGNEVETPKSIQTWKLKPAGAFSITSINSSLLQ